MNARRTNYSAIVADGDGYSTVQMTRNVPVNDHAEGAERVLCDNCFCEITSADCEAGACTNCGAVIETKGNNDGP